MRVIVLCTGRSGSVTFIEACKHISNYTAGHETRISTLGPDRFDYPDQHIEADNRLAWLTGELDKYIGKDAFYVHLIRDRDKVAKSFSKRYFYARSLIDAYGAGIKSMRLKRLSEEQRLQNAYDMVDSITANIEFFLRDKPNQAKLHLEGIGEDFPKIWERIGAVGDLESALKEFHKVHNPTKTNLINKIKSRLFPHH